MLEQIVTTCVKETLKELSKLNIKFNFDKAAPDIDSFVTLPPQIIEGKNPIFIQELQALKNTLSYCIDKLSLKCQLFVFYEGKVNCIIKITPTKSPKEYLKFLKKKNIESPKKFTYKGQNFVFDKNTYKRQDLRFMNCIVSQVEKTEDVEISFYGKRFEAISQKYSLPDGVFLLNASDTLVLRDDGKEPWVNVVGGLKPLFSGNYKKHIPILNSSSAVRYRDIPLPTFDELRYVWGKEQLKIEEVNLKWTTKKNIAIFRGSATGCGFTVNRNPRLKAAWLSQKYPKFINAGITAAVQKLKIEEVDRVGYVDMKKLNLKFSNFVSMEQQSNYKYILHLDGNVAAYRLSKSMLLGSVILIQESGTRLWFQHMLVPYVHYIPIKNNLSDLIDKIKWCQNNDEKCEEIAKNGKDFAEKILTEKACFDYICNVLWKV